MQCCIFVATLDVACRPGCPSDFHCMRCCSPLHNTASMAVNRFSFPYAWTSFVTALKNENFRLQPYPKSYMAVTVKLSRP